MIRAKFLISPKREPLRVQGVRLVHQAKRTDSGHRPGSVLSRAHYYGSPLAGWERGFPWGRIFPASIVDSNRSYP